VNRNSTASASITDIRLPVYPTIRRSSISRSYNFLVGEFPGVAANNGYSPPYLTDIAGRISVQGRCANITFDFGLAVMR